MVTAILLNLDVKNCKEKISNAGLNRTIDIWTHEPIFTLEFECLRMCEIF